MARRRVYTPLQVYLNSRRVGQLSRESSGAISFQYDPDWLTWGSTFPVSLSLPLREDAYIGAAVSAVFENLLPDNDGIRNRIAARARAAGIDAYSLLSVIGHDCVGALQFLAPDVDPGPAGRIEGTQISDDQIADLIRNLATTPLGISEDDSFRISIAGAQEKTALLQWQGQWYKPTGTTATTHILKPSIGRLSNGLDLRYSVENEYLCLKILSTFGLPVAAATMAQFGEKKVLTIERFDRLWATDGRLLRLPQEDCCQALSVPPTLKYESDGGPGIGTILHLLRDGDQPEQDQRAFMKAMILFWLLAATDGHAKNFSVALSPGGRYKMTPLYDVISAHPSLVAREIRPNQVKLAMAVGRSRHYRVNTIHSRHFVETGTAAGLGSHMISDLLDEVRDTGPAALQQTFEQLPCDFPERVTASIRLGFMNNLQRLQEFQGT